ncbi:hypothetical protein [Tautonia rosea]|uniref:hypothetical protein n=1 Tax=Tautonia rosea TaxID=2728037 RepID=UPI001475D79A|nr:hypothetical protein [Tautonia rosea]
MTFIKHIAIFALTTIVLSVHARESSAQVVPYKARGIGFYTPNETLTGGSYVVEGLGTHLGRHTGFGALKTEPTENPLVLNFVGIDEAGWIAADGSTVSVSMGEGQVQLIPLDPNFTTFTAVWTTTFTIEGGTRRFANAGSADEPLTVIAINQPFTFADPVWVFDWTVNGKFRLR